LQLLLQKKITPLITMQKLQIILTLQTVKFKYWGKSSMFYYIDSYIYVDSYIKVQPTTKVDRTGCLSFRARGTERDDSPYGFHNKV
jgi:hypothetical protein